MVPTGPSLQGHPLGFELSLALSLIPAISWNHPPGKAPPPPTVKDPTSGSTRPISDQKQRWGTGRYAGFDGYSGETAEGFPGGKRGCMTSTFRWPMVLSFSSLHTHLHTCMSVHMLPLDICTHACLCTYYHRNTKHLLQAHAKRSLLPAHGLWILKAQTSSTG